MFLEIVETGDDWRCFLNSVFVLFFLKNSLGLFSLVLRNESHETSQLGLNAFSFHLIIS